MVTDLEVRNFLKMSVFQKTRLMNQEPEKYNELVAAVKKNYNKESDPEAARDLEAKKS